MGAAREQTTLGGVAAVTVRSDVAGGGGQERLTLLHLLLPDQREGGASGLVVGGRSAVEGEDIQQIRPVEGRRDRQCLGVPGPGTDHSREGLADREAIVQTVDVDNVVATRWREGLIEGQQAVGLAVEHAVREITRAQARIQQILAGEAGVQVEAQVVVEADSTPIPVVTKGASTRNPAAVVSKLGCIGRCRCRLSAIGCWRNEARTVGPAVGVLTAAK